MSFPIGLLVEDKRKSTLEANERERFRSSLSATKWWSYTGVRTEIPNDDYNDEKADIGSLDSDTYIAEEAKPLNPMILPLFCLISFAYMFPWCSIGALIKYFTQTYGKSYFVMINITFYFAGFPLR